MSQEESRTPVRCISEEGRKRGGGGITQRKENYGTEHTVWNRREKGGSCAASIGTGGIVTGISRSVHFPAWGRVTHQTKSRLQESPGPAAIARDREEEEDI